MLFANFKYNTNVIPSIIPNTHTNTTKNKYIPRHQHMQHTQQQPTKNLWSPIPIPSPIQLTVPAITSTSNIHIHIHIHIHLWSATVQWCWWWLDDDPQTWCSQTIARCCVFCVSHVVFCVKHACNIILPMLCCWEEGVEHVHLLLCCFCYLDQASPPLSCLAPSSFQFHPPFPINQKFEHMPHLHYCYVMLCYVMLSMMCKVPWLICCIPMCYSVGWVAGLLRRWHDICILLCPEEWIWRLFFLKCCQHA